MPEAMHGLLDSFVFGAANSLHCAGMCGPIAACTLGGGAPRTATLAYHGGRIASYTLAGAAAGAVGATVGSDRLGHPFAWVSGLLGVVLLASATGWPRIGSWTRIPALGGILTGASRWAMQRPPVLRGGALGALTPLLPCGLLYALYPAALLAGDAGGGAVVMLGFACGSLPALWLAQANLGWLQRRWSPAARARLHRAVLSAAGAVLLWRAAITWSGGACCGAAP